MISITNLYVSFVTQCNKTRGKEKKTEREESERVIDIRESEGERERE